MRDAAQLTLRATALEMTLRSAPWQRAMWEHLGVTELPSVAPDPFHEGRVVVATWPALAQLFAQPRPGGLWRLWAIEQLDEVDTESMRRNAGALVEALWPRQEGRAA